MGFVKTRLVPTGVLPVQSRYGALRRKAEALAWTKRGSADRRYPMELTKQKKETLTDRVHDGILEMIIQNATNEEIVLNEGKLVENFGVSKAPVREALIRLCSEGVLENIPRYGYVVVRLTEKDERDIVNMRMLLETEALRANFDRIDGARLEELKAQIDRSCADSDMSIWKMLKFNEEFHLLLASFGEDKAMNRFLAESLQLQKRVYAKSWWKEQKTLDTKTNALPHMEIYRALRDRNLDGCIRILRRDIASDILE